MATKKQTLFVENYLKSFNATEAAKLAGYSERSAHAIGYELLRKPDISAIVKQRLENAAMSADECLARIAELARNGKTESTKAKALELIAKHHGALTERLEHAGGQEITFRVVYGDGRFGDKASQAAPEASGDQGE